MSEPPILRFPSDFLWGCAASAYQVEGALQEDGRGQANWDVFSRTPGKIFDGHVADPACDHYHRYKEDVHLMAELGLKAYRFSVAWPRVVPDGMGPVNQRGLDFYDRLVDTLLQHNIEPFLTLYHWDHPHDLDEKGGWRNRDFASWIAGYAAAVARRLGDRVRYWITLNEPPCIAHLGFSSGEHSPGLRLTEKEVAQVIHHILLGHGKTAQAVRQNAARPVRIGLAHNPDGKIPATEDPSDVAAARAAWRKANGWWFDPMFKGEYPADIWRERGDNVPVVQAGDMEAIAQPLDFMGLNIYQGEVVRGGASAPEVVPYAAEFPRTTMGWPITPDAMYWGPRFFHEEYPAPEVFVTENGASFDESSGTDGRVDDRPRVAFLASYLRQLHRALRDGVPVRGYFVWTLIDNFEWSHGYGKTFGLVRLDQGLRRNPKSSAAWYRRVIAAGGF
jgi:beta-glucosidase